MGAHRRLAISAMKAVTQKSIDDRDFLVQAGLPLPSVTIQGSLPATLRTQVSAADLKLSADVVLQWTIGDYPQEEEHSSYYDPRSPWYNVFFGAYAIRSYKPNGEAWGYHENGEPDFEEFLRVPTVDYNYFTAGQFGCPPEKMCFEILHLQRMDSKAPGWDCIQIDANVPSGLHDPVWSLASPGSYVVYGIPSEELLAGREPYEKLTMQGRMYMCRIPQSRIAPKIRQPITLAFGALCHPHDQHDQGPDLLEEIMAALTQAYLRLGPEA